MNRRPKVTMFGLDSGRSGVKGKSLNGQEREVEFVHGIAQITREQYLRETKRAGASADDFFIINDAYYVVGERALTRGFTLKLNQERYTPEYYGVLGAAAMTRSFQRSVDNVFWVGTHAPEDVDYTDDLLDSVTIEGGWDVVWRNQEYHFDVVDGVTLDEPLAGYYNATLKMDGTALVSSAITRGNTVMIDVGGQTTDTGAIYRDGEIDYDTFTSEDIGVLRAVEQFEADWITNNTGLMKGQKIDRMTLHEALRTGWFNLRGLNPKDEPRGYDVQVSASGLRENLAYEVINLYARSGGAARYDTVILTGGGAALLEKELRAGIRHNNIVLADKKAAELQLANVRGAAKWFQMHVYLGTWWVKI